MDSVKAESVLIEEIEKAKDLEDESTCQLPLLRFITCGSVDDGKSTLMGCLLYEANQVFDDQRESLARDSKQYGRVSGVDYSLILDGLAAEREQGITIDVAYRYFSTAKRQFILADTPGHEQYTCNMATGASTSNTAIVLVDARKGLVSQTYRHIHIVSLFGVKEVLLAVNKMDLVGFDEQVFNAIKASFLALTKTLGIRRVHAMPVSALMGANVVTSSAQMPWYKGPTVLTYLEDIAGLAPDASQTRPFRMAVQWVNRPNADFRGYAGRIASGVLKPGDKVSVLPGGQKVTITRLVDSGGDRASAGAGDSVTVTVDRDVELSRGHVLAAVEAPCQVADQFSVTLLWMAEKPLIPGRQYYLKCGTTTAVCTVGRLKYRLDPTTSAHLAASELNRNDIGECDIALDRDIAFEPFEVNQTLGGFILIDKLSAETLAAGLIRHALRRADNVKSQDLLIHPQERAAMKQQTPVVLWFTGLSGAGKSTLANQVEKALHRAGKHTMLLDGDNLRQGLNRDLDFSEAGRVENIRRAAEVAKLMVEAGLITLVSFISPYEAERDMAKQLIGEAQFWEIYVDASLAAVESRDVKGLYAKARRGEIPNFTGIGSPYEAPRAPKLRLDTDKLSVDEAVAEVLSLFENYAE